MPTIKKATIKSYSAATHKATVQIAGSLGVWLDAIRVATDIPAADVVAGRQCTVLFLDPANQDDAVVLTIQGALPSGGGGGTTDHGALTGLGDDDHPQYGALAQAETWAALQTFSAGIQLAASQQIQDSGGAGRILLAAASPHLTLTGDARLDGSLSVNVAPVATYITSINVTGTFGVATERRAVQIAAAPVYNASGSALYGISGEPGASLGAATSGHVVKGLQFAAAVGGSGSASAVYGLDIQTRQSGFSGTVTDERGINVAVPLFLFSTSAVVTTIAGIYIGNQGHARIADAYGLYIANITNNTGFKRLIEALGLTGPNLRVEAGDPTTAGAGFGRSQLLMDFNENGTITLRRVEWEDFATLAAGDKVLKAV